MRFKFVCFYRENDFMVSSWNDNPKVKVLNAKSKAEAAMKFRKNFPNFRLILVDKAI